MHTKLHWFILRTGMYLCCQTIIMYIVSADQNCVLEQKHHCPVQVHTEGADNCAIHHCIFSVLDHPEMLFRACEESSM